jgi:hypothetical protein
VILAPPRLLFQQHFQPLGAGAGDDEPVAAGPERSSAGTVVFIHDQEPPSLRPNWVDNTLYATSLVTNNIFLGGMIRDNNANWVLRNFASKPKLVKRNPMTVTFQIHPKAVWSDGRPVTCNDWRVGGWQLFINPANNVSTRTGWEDVKSMTCQGKKGTVVFKKVYADWETLIAGNSSGIVDGAGTVAGQLLGRVPEDVEGLRSDVRVPFEPRLGVDRLGPRDRERSLERLALSSRGRLDLSPGFFIGGHVEKDALEGPRSPLRVPIEEITARSR